MLLVVATMIGVYGSAAAASSGRRAPAAQPWCFPSSASPCCSRRWSGLPLVLGVAGALLGYTGRNPASGRGSRLMPSSSASCREASPGQRIETHVSAGSERLFIPVIIMARWRNRSH